MTANNTPATTRINVADSIKLFSSQDLQSADCMTEVHKNFSTVRGALFADIAFSFRLNREILRLLITSPVCGGAESTAPG
jgi:hypothetical protein